MKNLKINKVLIAIDSFKGSISSAEAAEIIADGMKDENQDLVIEIIPVADGGEGTLETIINHTGGKFFSVEVNNPLMNKIEAEYGILPDNKTAVIEMARASGLTLIEKEKRNPLIATSFGTGELILDAVKRGCSHIILGIGGSATNDAGIGTASALGIQFFDVNGKRVGINNEALQNIHSIDASKKKIPDDIKFTILCDVQNPLLGEEGATFVYAKQKGADPEMLIQMEENIKHYALKVEDIYGQSLTKIDGIGAAGGIGCSLKAFFNARLLPGIDFMTEILDLEEKIKSSDLVITGEGKLDEQSFNNKVPVGISKIAKKHNKRVIGVTGIDEAENKIKIKHFDKVFSIVNTFGITPEESVKNVKFYLKEITKKIGFYIKEL